jgi:predicted nucleic acid-binding protein
MERDYWIAGKHRSSVYDAAFALAVETGLELKTPGKRQADIMRRASGR